MPFESPAIGTKVRVTTDWSEVYKGFAANVPRTHTVEGFVIESEEFDEPNTFRLFDERDYWFPQKVIPMQKVSALVVITDAGEAALEFQTKKPSTEVKIHLVKGSKGNNYTITEKNGSFSCDCLAGQHGRRCKHVQELRVKLMPRG